MPDVPLSSSDPLPEAIAVQHGEIVKIGSTKEVKDFAKAKGITDIQDLQQAVVLPGLHDVHQHPLEVGSSIGGTCDLRPYRDMNPNDPEVTAYLDRCWKKQRPFWVLYQF